MQFGTQSNHLIPNNVYHLQRCGTGTGTVGTVTFWLVKPEPEPKLFKSWNRNRNLKKYLRFHNADHLVPVPHRANRWQQQAAHRSPRTQSRRAWAAGSWWEGCSGPVWPAPASGQAKSPYGTKRKRASLRAGTFWIGSRHSTTFAQNIGSGLAALQFTIFRDILAGKNGIRADPWHWNIGFSRNMLHK